jgi:hypothetical protein
MPIATLTFDLSDPDEAEEHLLAVKGRDSRFCLQELDENLRGALKYHPEGRDDLGTFPLDERTVSWVRKCLGEIVQDANLPEV